MVQYQESGSRYRPTGYPRYRERHTRSNWALKAHLEYRRVGQRRQHIGGDALRRRRDPPPGRGRCPPNSRTAALQTPGPGSSGTPPHLASGSGGERFQCRWISVFIRTLLSCGIRAAEVALRHPRRMVVRKGSRHPHRWAKSSAAEERPPRGSPSRTFWMLPRPQAMPRFPLELKA